MMPKKSLNVRYIQTEENNQEIRNGMCKYTGKREHDIFSELQIILNGWGIDCTGVGVVIIKTFKDLQQRNDVIIFHFRRVVLVALY